MSSSPDSSRFTACVIGEATPEEQSAFDAALLKDAGLREEAVTLSRTAHRLTQALKGEEPVSLTIHQRNHVIQQGATQPVPLRTRVRPAWFGPTMATAGIAAFLALGFYVIPDKENSTPVKTQETGIPTVAIQSGAVSTKGSRPIAPPPSVATEGRTAPMLEVRSPEKPASLQRPAAIAATPPNIRLDPAPVPPALRAAKDSSPGGRPLPGNKRPVESLASPLVLPP